MRIITHHPARGGWGVLLVRFQSIIGTMLCKSWLRIVTHQPFRLYITLDLEPPWSCVLIYEMEENDTF